ncbi:MAG TPA: hypothetical protein VH369_11575 [Bryobacteraceae bacterium]|jgi:hypothetical protein
MAVTFRYARLDEYPQIAGFLDQYWAKDHIYVRDKKLFDWTFQRASHWEEPGYSFALAEDGGQLVGILGGIPFSFNSFGTSASGIWIANYVVRPDYRKGSTALQLLSVFRNLSRHAVVAFGINPATSAIYRVLRGEVLPYLPRRFALFPGADERLEHLLALAYPDWEAARARSLAGRFRPTKLDGHVAHGASLPEQWDTVDWPAIARETIGASRDGDYLRWRYLDHPRFAYRIVTLPERERTGLLVWRLETIQRSVPEGREDIDRIARIVELLPASEENGRLLLAAALGEMEAAGALGADFYGYHAGANRALEEVGFLDCASIEDGERLPSRFQPLDGKGGGILSAMFLKETAPGFAPADSAWYWTKSDSDQDRPN